MTAAVDFSGVSMPFGVGDMLSTATNFLSVYGEWALLGVSVPFVAALVGLIFYFQNKAAANYAKERNARYEARRLREEEHQRLHNDY